MPTSRARERGAITARTQPPRGELDNSLGAVTDHAAAAKLGVHDTFDEDSAARVDGLPEFEQLAAQGRFNVPIA